MKEQAPKLMNASMDPVSIETMMKKPPGIYIGTTGDGKRAVIKISDHDPVVNMQVSQGDGLVHVTEYYKDGTIQEYDKTIKI